ncbi:MAG: hypothetical protein R3F55_23110 [Alphaproteobacteria bacterium]
MGHLLCRGRGMLGAIGIAGLVGTLAACVPAGGQSGGQAGGQSGGQSGGIGFIPVTTPPVGASGGAAAPTRPAVTTGRFGEIADSDLRNLVSGISIQGTDIAGSRFCSYYDPNGTVTTVTPGAPSRSGTWTITNGQVCESKGGTGSCSRFDFQPPTYQTVTMTATDGSGAFPLTGAVSDGNACGSSVTPGVSPDQVNGYSVSQVTFTDAQGIRLGTYRNNAAGSWVETDASGAVTFTFTEMQRDEWSVYLRDYTRNVDIQLDLYTREVKYAPAGQQRAALYRISDAR